MDWILERFVIYTQIMEFLLSYHFYKGKGLKEKCKINSRTIKN